MSPAQPHHLHCCFPPQILIRPRRPSCFLQVDWLPPLLLMLPSWPVPSRHLLCLQRGLESGFGSGRNQAEDPQRHQPPSRGLDHLCVEAPGPPWGHMPSQPFPCLQTAGTVGFRAESTSPWAESTRGPGGWSQDRHHLHLPPGSGRQDLARPHVDHEGRQQARAGMRSTQAGAPGVEPWPALAPLWPPHPRQEKAELILLEKEVQSLCL